MTDLASPKARRAPWTHLLEDRFTNIDIVMFVGALALVSVIGALSGASLMF